MSTDPTGYISIPYQLMRGLSWKIAVRCATTASITISTALNNGDTIDGITLVTGDRVLVKNQSTASQNGIYIVGASPTRAADMDQDLTTAIPAEEIAGAVVFVISGTANASTIWYTTNAVGGTIGSTSITWTQFSPGGGVTGFATPAVVLGTAAAAGAATTVIRSDSTIVAFDATVPTTQAFGDSAATGSAAVAARRDHKHGEPTAAVTTSGLTQATGKLLGRTTASTGAIEEITVGTGLTLSAGTLTGSAQGVGPIIISDTPSTPLIFADLIQNEAQDDLVYADI
jgi:hypothetical protein